MKRIFIYLMIVLPLFVQSCIKENLSKCNSELLLRFRYTLNNQNINLFDSEVNRVTVYVFDNNGKYVANFSEQGDKLTNDYVMRIPLPAGQYSVVAFGGDLNTYSAGELNAQNNTFNELLRVGETDINDFRLMLKNTIGDEGYLFPVGTPDDLYAGLALDAVSRTQNENVTDVELMKDTKKIKVKVTGTDAIGAPLDIYITAKNGRYGYDNNIDLNHGTFKYLPFNTIEQPNYTEVDLKTLRLIIGQSPMLVIKNRTTSEIIYNENLVEQILLIPNFVSQQDIDREDEFVFEINIGTNNNTIVISVSINGWVIQNITPDR